MSVAGRLHSWDLSTGVDGPGTRFVAFTAGCPLRCLYCANPDTWRMRSGTATTSDAVLADVERYRRFITAAGGGFTVSGGEPLLQPAFTGALLAGARDLGLHTALDTSGFLGARATDDLLDACGLVLLDIKSWDRTLYRRLTGRDLHTALDTSGFLGARATDDLLDACSLVLLDIKSWDRTLYRRLTGRDLHPTLTFARRLAGRGTPVWVRFVLVPGLTDDPDNVGGVARFAAGLGNVERVDVLPFHRLGAHKYRDLGLRFPLADVEPPDETTVARALGQFRETGLLAV